MATGVAYTTKINARGTGNEVVVSDFFTISGVAGPGLVNYRTVELPLNIITAPSLTNQFYVRTVDPVTHIPLGPVYAMVIAPTAPTAGQFQIADASTNNNTFRFGYLVFNQMDAGSTVEIIYTGRGSLVFANDVDDIQDELLAGRSSYFDIDARFDAIESGASLTNITASKLSTTGAPIDISAAAPPTAGQVLTATDATHATWQTPTPGGVTQIVAGTNVTISPTGGTGVVTINSTGGGGGGGGSTQRADYVVGTPSGSYSGSATIFNIAPITHVPGSGDMEVYASGLIRTVGASFDYLETSATVVTFNTPLVVGSNVAFVIPGGVAGTTPGGSNTQIQFNNAGILDGAPTLTWNGTIIGISAPMTFSGANTNVIDNPVGEKNKIRAHFNMFTDLPAAATYHGMFAHVHDVLNNGTNYGGAYFAHSAGWMRLLHQDITGGSTYQNVYVGPNATSVRYADPSSLLELDSTGRGFLPPRMTTTQRNAISSPATGLEIFNLSTLQPEVYNGTAWTSMGGGGGGSPGGASGAVQFNNAGAFGGNAAKLFWDATNFRLGVDNGAPAFPLDVTGGINTTANYFVGGVQLSSANLLDGGTLTATKLKDTTAAVDVSGSTAPTSGQVLTATDATHATWQTPGAGPSGTVVANEFRQDYTATASQTNFVTTQAFVAGGVNAEVYRNGDLQRIGGGFDYTESGTNTIIFNTGLAAGETVSIRILTGTVLAAAQWIKYTVAHTALAAAATTNDIALFSLPAGTMVENVVVKHSTSFTGGGISAYTVSVGITGNLAKYASAFDVFQATGSSVAQVSGGGFIEDFVSSTSVRIAATSTGANLNAATAGIVDVWVKQSTLP